MKENFLTVIFKSLLTTIVIGYIVFNITYIKNECPKTNVNVLELCEDPCVSGECIESRSIVFDQFIIFNHYSKWIFKAFSGLDFGKFEESTSRDVFTYSMKAMINSFLLIFLSLLIGLLLSIIAIYFGQNKNVKHYIVEPFLSISFIHLAIFVVLFRFIVTDASLVSTFLVCFITAIGSGILFDFYTLLDNEYSYIMNKDYVTFARSSGFDQYKFASKELLVTIIYISTSRIPILFGSMIMVEIMSKGVYEGIGVAIWKHIWTMQELNYNASFGTTFLCVIVFSFLYYFSDYLKKYIIDR